MSRKGSAFAFRILEPFNGDIMNRHDGVRTDAGLRVTVRGQAPLGVPVLINGAEAQREGDNFVGSALLTQQENIIKAWTYLDGEEIGDTVTVLWDRDSFPRYRFSVDDNIECLKDLAHHQDHYRSIFDSEYFGFWRQMHETYQAKVQFNIFFETEGFNLSQMPDKYKAEWEDNADWIRLTFHARRNWPAPEPGLTYAEIERDFLLVTDQITRFAGHELLSSFTTLHHLLHGGSRYPYQALRDHGIKGFGGFFVFHPGIRGLRPPRVGVACYLEEPIIRHLAGRDYWKDVDEGLFFIKGDLVVEYLPPEDIVPYLDELGADPHRSEVVDIFTHEQWFWPELRRPYKPEITYDDPAIREKVSTALKWVTEHGYQPAFYDEGFLGTGVGHY